MREIGKGQFTIRSIYLHMTDHNTLLTPKLIWKLRIPLKIKIFPRYLQWGKILTKDNLAQRNWKGSKKYCYCHCNKTIKHIFFDCHPTRTICRIVYIATGLTIKHLLYMPFSGEHTGCNFRHCSSMWTRQSVLPNQ